MSYESVSLQAKDGYVLSLHAFDVPSPKAVVKCIHGMEEHKERYIPFAEFLRENGYAVVTADLRGHGESAPVLSHIADTKGEELLISDELEELTWLKRRWPGVPIVLFAHSMGTIIARKLLQTHSRDFAAVVLSGYPNPQPVAGIAMGLTSFLRLFKGWTGHSSLVDSMTLGGFSKAVPNAETPLDWLSYDTANRDAYIADPLCGSPFSLGSYHAMFALLKDIDDPSLCQDVKADLPLLLISGADDPCTGGEQGRATSLERLTGSGFTDITVTVLPGMRHEILNETARYDVYGQILSFLEK